jgi:ABC-2 type transport system ATP-binding protein
MDEAQYLADRVVVIAGGRIIADGTPETLGRGDGDASHVSFRVPAGIDPDELPLPDNVEVQRHGDAVRFGTSTPTQDLAPLLSWAAVRGAELEALTVSRPSLEDVYLQLTRETA